MTTLISSGDRISAALYEALNCTTHEASSCLSAELARFKAKYPVSYREVCKQPFARKLIEAIEIATIGEKP